MKTSPTPHTNQNWLARALSFDTQPPDEIPSHTTIHNETLADFQTAAVTRTLAIVRRFGGAILADGVGLGKTRMGLAIARQLLRDATWTHAPGRTIYACIPSKLRIPWQRAALDAGWQIPTELQFISHAELSLRTPDLSTSPPAAILVDEAHRFHNPNSQRSRNLAKITAHAPTILLTATPICNSIWDLYHLLTLFLAEHDLRDHIGMNLHNAFTLAQNNQFDLAELAKILTIRRRIAPQNTHFGQYPSVRLKVLNYDASPDERWLWHNLEQEISKLSLTLLRDNWPRPLFHEFILKRWESGAEALAQTLQKLAQYHHRWLEAHATGRTLSRPDFHRLFSDSTSHQQAVFPFLYENPAPPTPDPQTTIPLDSTQPNPPNALNLVKNDLQLLETLLKRAEKQTNGHSGATKAITNLLDHRLEQNPSEKLLIFTSYQHAAQGIYRAICQHLGTRARVGLVTGRGARATGLGKSAPHDIIRRFAPIATGEPNLPHHQQLDILVCTDCLSEGINLQDCNRVVLADLPYTPLRVEQRIGRLMRPTATTREVIVYLPRPREWNDSLGLRRRLNTKLGHAQSAGTNFEYASVLNPTTPKSTLPAHTTQKPLPTEPLAVLTTLDQLARNLNAHHVSQHPNHPQKTIFYTGTCPKITTPQLWLRAVLEGAPHPIWLWCKTDPTSLPEMRTSALIKELITLADLQFKITPGPPDPALLTAATNALETRLQLLQAARFAPMPLASDSPQQQIWQQLSAWIQQTPPKPDNLKSHDPNQLRQRILQPFPRGIERNLSELLARNLTPDRLFHHINQLQIAPPPQCLTLRIALGLQINPSA